MQLSIVLSNNTFKLQQLEAHGFQLQRVKSLDKIDTAGKREAQQRGEDFAHLRHGWSRTYFRPGDRKIEK